MSIPKKILLADDDLMLVEMYHMAVENAGFTVIEAHDGEEAFAYALKERPDLVVLDMNMPKKNGITVLKEIRETKWGKTLPIIIFTGFDATNSDIHKITEFEPNYYIIKGAETMDEFIAKIKELLGV